MLKAITKRKLTSFITIDCQNFKLQQEKALEGKKLLYVGKNLARAYDIVGR